VFQIGFWELVVVAIVALCVFGPDKLAIIARISGRRLARVKQFYMNLKNEFQTEFTNRDR
jgi:sec-independent protein translocase protein TatB